MGVGVLNGRAREKVYEAESGQKISQLNWSMKQVPTLHLGPEISAAEVAVTRPVRLDACGKRRWSHEGLRLGRPGSRKLESTTPLIRIRG